MTALFITKYPIVDKQLEEILDFTELNQRALDANARDNYEYPANPTPRQQHDFDWALEEIKLHDHFLTMWCHRNGRVV